MAKLSTTLDKIEVTSNKTVSSGAGTAINYPSAKLVTNTYKNMLNLCRPIGSFYETTDANFDPNVTWGPRGEIWELHSSGITRKLVSSQVIHPGLSGTGVVAKTNLCGAYNTELLGPLHSRFAKKGYHAEYKFSVVITTGNNNGISLFLNNTTLLYSMTTWSDNLFRRTFTSDFIKLSDIAQTPAAGYTSNGYTLAYEARAATNGSTYTWQFWDVTAHCYLVSDSPVYKWRRIA